MVQDLRGKVIVITGASSGIGAATAVEAGAAGMDVVLGARRFDRLEKVAQQIESQGGRALPVVCDVDRQEDVQHLVNATVERFGRLDVLFANAGWGMWSSVLETTESQLRAIFETNFFGTVRCIQAAVPVMLKLAAQRADDTSAQGRFRGGHVVIDSSVVSEIGLPMNGAYCATKAAQDAIASALRAELTRDGIYVTSVHPIGTRTEFAQRIACASGESPTAVENTPRYMMQSAESVARKIVRCLSRPRPEVWPHAPTRLALAVATAFPGLAAWAMRRLADRSSTR